MTNSSGLVARIHHMVDFFVPEEIAVDREKRQQARMFLISHLFGPFIGNSVPLALYIFDPNPGYQILVLTLSITSFWLFPPLLRLTGRYNILALISIQNLNFCILWSCYFYGGITSPTLPWILTIPLLAFFYIGSSPSLRVIVLGIFLFNVAGFWAVNVLLPPPPIGMPLSALQALGLISTIAASLYVAMMALFYGKALASQTELEAAMRKHLETASKLRRATAEAERAGAAKADFLAKMSHELRTPLNAVIGYSQMLLEDAADEGEGENVADLKKIHDAGQHLLKLVDDILDLSKIEAEKMEVYSEICDLGAIVTGVVDQMREPASAKGLVLSAKFEHSLGKGKTDVRKLRQIVRIVLENGIKFTERGFVSLTAKRGEAGELMITVKDTGVGIPKERLATLFEQFYDAGDASGSKYGGTGLGLALGQKLSHLLGGKILVESTEGVGSSFTVCLPIESELAEAPVPARQNADRPVTTLDAAPLKVAANA